MSLEHPFFLSILYKCVLWQIVPYEPNWNDWWIRECNRLFIWFLYCWITAMSGDETSDSGLPSSWSTGCAPGRVSTVGENLDFRWISNAGIKPHRRHKVSRRKLMKIIKRKRRRKRKRNRRRRRKMEKRKNKFCLVDFQFINTDFEIINLKSYNPLNQ